MRKFLYILPLFSLLLGFMSAGWKYHNLKLCVYQASFTVEMLPEQYFERVIDCIGYDSQNVITESRKNAVRDLVYQGMSDPIAIQDALNFDNNGTMVGDFTIEEVQQYMAKGRI